MAEDWRKPVSRRALIQRLRRRLGPRQRLVPDRKQRTAVWLIDLEHQKSDYVLMYDLAALWGVIQPYERLAE